MKSNALNLKENIAIKIPVPRWEVAHQWGEYHFAMSLKKYLERKKWSTKVQIYPEWNSNEDEDCSVALVLRGNRRYKPKKNHYNIMWNICHPDQVTINEYNSYDYVFVASNIWANYMSGRCNVPIEPLLQCTDIERFFPSKSREYNHELLFVGNSRFVYRKIIRDIDVTKYSLAVYGEHWDRFINKKYIKGSYIPNSELNKVYSSCEILLNDHWDDMRKNGFISNRIFDGFASGTFIISDNIHGYKEVFKESLVTYNTKKELNDLIKEYLDNEILRDNKAKEGYEIVTKNHTFEKRVERILEIIKINVI